MSCKLSCGCCKWAKKNKNGKRKKRVKNAASPENLQRAAVRLVNGEGNIQCKNKYHWQVRSESSTDELWYNVRITDKGFKCDCKYHTKRKDSACKHMLAIEILILQEIETPGSGETTTLDKKGVYCPKCKSEHFKKNGTRNRKKRSPAQRYKCLNLKCNKHFTDKPDLKGRHYPSSIILMAILLFGMGDTVS